MYNDENKSGVEDVQLTLFMSWTRLGLKVDKKYSSKIPSLKSQKKTWFRLNLIAKYKLFLSTGIARGTGGTCGVPDRVPLHSVTRT